MPPVGPTGLPIDCDGSAPPTLRLGGTLARAGSRIVFDGEVTVPFHLYTATASLGRFATPRHGWTVSASGILGGEIEGRDVQSGAGLGGAYTYLPLFETEGRPFVALTGIISAAFARATADDGRTRSWTALDVRASAMVGKSLQDNRFIVYAAGRAFGGPVFWRRTGKDVVGGDRYHVTFGAGATWNLSPRLSLSLEVMPLGEQSFSGGATVNL